MLSILAKLLKALNSEASPSQISLAVCFALIMALTPLLSWHNAIVLLLALVIKVNLSAFIVSLGLFSLLAWFVDPYSASLGEQILTAPGLQETWTSLYQIDFLRITKFNHTLVMGGLVVSLIAFLPVFFLCRFLVVQYRAKLLVWVEKLWIAKLIKGSKFYRIYQAIAS